MVLKEILAKLVAELPKASISSLNAWMFYVLVLLVCYAKFGIIITAIIFAFFAILWNSLKEETRKELKSFWQSLPLLKFHGVSILIQLAILGWVLKLSNLTIISGNIFKKYGNKKQ